MAAKVCQPCFLDLPDVALLSVLRFLETKDVINVSKINDRFKKLCTESAVVRHCKFEGSYFLKEEDVRSYVSGGCHSISTLNLNHCYWLSQRTIQWLCNKCRNLTALHLMECRMKIEPLVAIVAAQPKLTALSFSITTFSNITKDVFTPAKDTLARLRRLHIYYTSNEQSIMNRVMNYLGEHHTILDHCANLEQLLINSTGMAVPELYRPVLTIAEHHRKLKDISITYNIHAGAQMFFYGTLSQLPNAQISWRTLLMPNVNFPEFAKKEEFLSCFCKVENLENLDVSGAKVTIPTRVIDMQKTVKLRYINLSCSSITSRQLKYIATYCHQLVSLNLFGCSGVLKKRLGFDGSGLETVFSECKFMKHLNLGGEHHHLHQPQGDPVLRSALTSIKGLHSLSLPTCMLCCKDPSKQTTGKRIMMCRPVGQQAAKRRITHAGPVGVYHDADSATAGTSSGSASAGTKGPLLPEILANNPELHTLEIIAMKYASVFQRNRFINTKSTQFDPCRETYSVTDEDIKSIQGLKELKYLTLAGLPGVRSGTALEEICRHCPKLEYLSLSYLDLGGHQFSLISNGLQHCHALTDLRIEQPYMLLNASFFNAVSTCKRLERLCLIVKHSTFQQQDVLKMMEQLPRLCILQLFAGGTLTLCRSLTNALNKRYAKTRPGMHVCIFPLLHNDIPEAVCTIPAKHLDELTRFDSRVCLLPPGFDRS